MFNVYSNDQVSSLLNICLVLYLESANCICLITIGEAIARYYSYIVKMRIQLKRSVNVYNYMYIYTASTERFPLVKLNLIILITDSVT